MFIQQAFSALHEWWRYLLGSILVIAGFFIGQVPLTLAIFLEAGMSITTMTEKEMLGVLDSNLFFFLLLLSFAIGLMVLLVVIKYLHEQTLKKAVTSRRKMDWGRFFFGFGLIAIFSVVVTFFDFYSNPEDYIWNFNFIPFVILVCIAVLMIPLQTTFEELLFRGYLLQGIGVIARNRWLPLLATSFIFGGMHFWNPEVDKMGNIIMIYYIGTGLLLGIMTLMDEGTELALGFHAGNNLIGVILVTADWTAFQTNSILKDISDPSAGLEILAPVFIVYPIFLGLMAWRYKWTNWKEKLFGKVYPPEETTEPSNVSGEI